MIDLSVIIVNWNVKDYLVDCIHSIYSSVKHITFEIIVVDNGSTDGSVETIRKVFSEVIVIANKNNIGFGKANNVAANQCNGRYILFLNPDTVVLSNALDYVIKYLDTNLDVGAAGCKIKCVENGFIGGARHFPSLTTEFIDHLCLNSFFPNNKIFGYYTMSYWNYNDTRDIDVLSGSFIMLRRQIMQTVGLFDENFFMYGEDIDLCYRIKKAKWRIVFVSNAEIIHYGEKSAMQTHNGEIEVESLWSKYYYFKKNKGKMYAHAYRVILIFIYTFWYIIWLILYIMSSPQKRQIRKSIKNKRKLFICNLIQKPKLRGNL